MYELLYSIISGFVGGLISIPINNYLYRKKLEDDIRRKHFGEIKENCLKQIRENLNELLSNFEISEDFIKSCEGNISLVYEINWWNNYSFRKNVKDKILYDDLSNHFPELVRKLNEIENRVVKENIPKYLSLLEKVTNNIISEYREDESLERFIGEPIEHYYSLCPELTNSIIMIVFRYDIGHWPNVYKTVKTERLLCRANETANKLKQDRQVQEMLSIRERSKKIINKTLNDVEKLLHMNKLEGECEYIKI